MTNRQMKTAATKAEYNNVYNNFNPPCDIYAEMANGDCYKRELWQSVNNFGWGKWKLQA